MGYAKSAYADLEGGPLLGAIARRGVNSPDKCPHDQEGISLAYIILSHFFPRTLATVVGNIRLYKTKILLPFRGAIVEDYLVSSLGTSSWTLSSMAHHNGPCRPI